MRPCPAEATIPPRRPPPGRTRTHALCISFLCLCQILRSRAGLRPRPPGTSFFTRPTAQTCCWSSGRPGAVPLGSQARPAEGAGALRETQLLDQSTYIFQVGLSAPPGPRSCLPLFPSPLLPGPAQLCRSLCPRIRQRLGPPPQAPLVQLPPLPLLPVCPAPDVVPVLRPRPGSLAARDLGRHDPQHRIRPPTKRQEPPPPVETPPRAPVPPPTG